MAHIQDDQAKIEQLVGEYIEGINQSSADKLLQLFASDGVVMAPDAPTMAGTEQLEAFFGQGFKEVRLSAQIFLTRYSSVQVMPMRERTRR